MPLYSTPACQSRKRKVSEVEPIAAPLSQPSSKRLKPEGHRRHRAPSTFWDNLSKQWLTPRALREFDRRTVRPVFPLPPDPSSLKKDHIAELKRFARHGGPSLGDLRAYTEPETTTQPNPTMSSRASASRDRVGSSSKRSSSSKTSTTRKTSAYDAGFEQHLVENGIYPEGYNDIEPTNLDEINERLAQPRASLSPSRFSREVFLDFKRKNREAYNEAKVMSSVFPIIAGNPNIPSQEDVMYTNLAPLTDGTITAPMPDFYDGALPQQLDRRVWNGLGQYIVPSKNFSSPALPNFFAEAKGPDGSAAVAKRQACYDGAIGARGMLHARSYASGDDMEYDGSAYTITSTYHNSTGTLMMYTTHPTQPAESGGKPNYHMTQLRSFALTDTAERFREGAGAFRNARDWAKEQRDEAITRANAKANNSSGGVSGVESFDFTLLSDFASEAPSQASATSVDEAPYTIEPLSQETSFTSDTAVHESDTSTDELAVDLKTPPKRSSSRHPKQLQQSRRKRRNSGTPSGTHTYTTGSTSSTGVQQRM